MDNYDISRITAYEGKIGRQRRGFCEKMAALCQDYNRTAMAELAAAAKAKGRSMTCQPGCSSCCTQYVGATLQEAEAIVYYLYNHTADELTFFIGNYKAWRARVGREAILEQINQAARSVFEGFHGAETKDFVEMSDQYRRLKIQCPFLKENLCSIYPARPRSCASVISCSPASYCEPTSESVPDLLFFRAAGFETVPYFWGPEESLIYSSAPLLVHEILHGGYVYLSHLPGLAGVDEAAFSDPAVRNSLQ